MEGQGQKKDEVPCPFHMIHTHNEYGPPWRSWYNKYKKYFVVGPGYPEGREVRDQTAEKPPEYVWQKLGMPQNKERRNRTRGHLDVTNVPCLSENQGGSPVPEHQHG